MGKEIVPTILKEGVYKTGEVESLKQIEGVKIIDLYKQQLEELFEIDNPELLLSSDFKKKRQTFVAQKQSGNSDVKGSWVYFPWSNILIHTVDEVSYFRLRTNRNKNLITAAEQDKLYSAKVGITGLSVGNSIATSLAYSGIGAFHLADFDDLETANLNRMRAGLQDIGKSKLDITTEQIYEIDPYANIETWPSGLKEKDLEGFLNNGGGLDVVFDEIDDFEMKIRLRLAARKAQIPVLMFTSLGDNILVDIERYDLEPDMEIFGGLIGDVPEDILNSEIGEKEKIKYAMKTVGIEHIPTRALGSLLEINKTLVGRPQLYGTVAADGGLAAYIVKRLILGWDLPSGRHYIPFSGLFGLSRGPEDNREEILTKLMTRVK